MLQLDIGGLEDFQGAHVAVSLARELPQLVLKRLHLLALLVELVADALRLEPQLAGQFVRLLELRGHLLELAREALMLVDEALQLELGLVERLLEDLALLDVVEDLVLQFALLLQQLVALLHELDLVVRVGGELLLGGALRRGEGFLGLLGLPLELGHPGVQRLELPLQRVLLLPLLVQHLLRRVELALRGGQLLLYCVQVEHHVLNGLQLAGGRAAGLGVASLALPQLAGHVLRAQRREASR